MNELIDGCQQKGLKFYLILRLMFCSLFQILEEFYNIFGPELKAVTGDPKRIEEVLVRVDALVTPLEEVGVGVLL